MRRRRYQPNIKKNSTFGLNITSMTDMFTILLVFLLQSYSTSDVEILPVKGMRLPSSNTPLNPVEGVKINLTKDKMLIDQKEIATLSNSDFERKDVDANDSNFILPLFQELDKMAKEMKDKKYISEGRVLLQADASMPYHTLRKVMYTASLAGFPQLKMVTTVGQ
jgi:biopolymer transport protein ExbD